MASTPSASALSAVLRCRGNLFARNKANKNRPPLGSGYTLGVKCGVAGESVVPILGKEHGWDFGHTLRECKSLFLGQRVEITDGVFLTVKLEASRKNKKSTHTDYQTAISDYNRRKVSKITSRTDLTGAVDFTRASLSQAAQKSTGHRPRFSDLVSEPDCSRAHFFTSGIRKCVGIKNYGENAVYSKNEKKLLEKASAWKVLFISITYSPKSDRAGEQITEPVVLCWNDWTTLKNGCIILSVIISEMLRMQFGMENGRFSIPSVFKPAVVESENTSSRKPVHVNQSQRPNNGK